VALTHPGFNVAVSIIGFALLKPLARGLDARQGIVTT
jgi:hypothetical protein